MKPQWSPSLEQTFQRENQIDFTLRPGRPRPAARLCRRAWPIDRLPCGKSDGAAVSQTFTSNGSLDDHDRGYRGYRFARRPGCWNTNAFSHRDRNRFAGADRHRYPKAYPYPDSNADGDAYPHPDSNAYWRPSCRRRWRPIHPACRPGTPRISA